MALLVGLLLGSCASEGGTGASWPTAVNPVEQAEPMWVTGSVLHLGDGTRLDLGHQVLRFVAAGGGVYFVSSDEEARDLAASESDGIPAAYLFFADRDGVQDTGARIDWRSLHASPDGRYLAYIDRVSGPTEQYDYPVAEAVIIDLERGHEVVRSRQGMGWESDDPDHVPDLPWLYEESPPGVLGVSNEFAWVATTEGVLAVDLASGGTAWVADEEALPWTAPRYDDPSIRYPGPWNTEGTWAIATTHPRSHFVSADGDVLVPEAPGPSWGLSRWLDETTAFGAVVDEAPTEAGWADTDALATWITCTVPDGVCRPIPGAEGIDRLEVLLPHPSQP
ncbi:hypothetical protein [Nocardioides limicola]|uniref:hypothetical protein n=1 Tax=Nocardioides limicola TaxID=2803368 RepID=UPI00193B278F|nr:hypothetical protein [Nocardioides sp. DJM-14]